MIELAATAIFALALVHVFAASLFERLAHRHPAHAGLLHLLGEVEVVFGLWAFVLIIVLALGQGSQAALAYAESRQYTEPLFVFVVMVIAASRPVLLAVRQLTTRLARWLPLPHAMAQVWLGLALVPVLGSLITEPAAMTLAALLLSAHVFKPSMPERQKYFVLGALFVNVSIGGTLTAYAAPPVLMVASAWQWSTPFMAATFGWKAVIAVLVNASLACWLLRAHLGDEPVQTAKPAAAGEGAWVISIVHLLFLGAVVMTAHHPVIFLGLFLFFLGFTEAYERHQDPLILREGLLVGFFLAGLVVLGGLQQWWLQPLVSDLPPVALFFGTLGLTALTDNAALTYLGSLIEGLSPHARYMLMAGAVAGGGLTVIANAPNPAGVALLRHGFKDHHIGAGGLLLGALIPTAVAALMFLAFQSA
jgi:hypothetical protein